MSVKIITGDCRQVLRTLDADSIDSCVTDPPYHLTEGKKGGIGIASLNPKSPAGRSRIGTGFMGKAWDGGDVFFQPETWAEVYRVLKPGAYLLAFGGARTYHRLACAIEDAGFEIRDQIMWIYGSGFPKSLDVSKAIAKAAGAEREVVGTKNAGNGNGRGPGFRHAGGADGLPVTEPATGDAARWAGWGTALKPSHEPIVVARKPLIGTVAANVLQHGTGAINIDAARIHGEDAKGGAYTVRRLKPGATLNKTGGNWRPEEDEARMYHGEMKAGRWPANIIHDGSNEAIHAFPNDGKAGDGEIQVRAGGANRTISDALSNSGMNVAGKVNVGIRGFGDGGSAARFFYCAKATEAERGPGNNHPTVKPLALARYLLRLVTPPSGRTLDICAGSGTFGVAAQQEGFDATLIELEPAHVEIAVRRLRADAPLLADIEVAA
ncbi:MAG: DNA methyltransferase [Solimonas sp.]